MHWIHGYESVLLLFITFKKGSLFFYWDLETKNICIEYCGCLPLDTSVIAASAFPSQDPRFVFALDALSAYRALNLRSGLALKSFVDVMTKFQPHLPSTTYRNFGDAYGAYRAIMFDIERLDNVLDEGCPACPRPNEPGEHYWALDGNFRLFRYKSSSRECNLLLTYRLSLIS
jgi:hypothetical protein